MEQSVTARGGKSITITLPLAMARRLGITAGTELWVAECDGGLFVTPRSEARDACFKAYRAAADGYEQVMRALRAEEIVK